MHEDLDKLANVPFETGSWGEAWEEQAEYPPACQPGNQRLVIDNIRRVTPFEYPPGTHHLGLTADFRAIGGTYDGQVVVRFQDLNTFKNERTGSSFIEDMLNSAEFPEPGDFAELGRFVNVMADESKECVGQVDWEGFCTQCYGVALLAAVQPVVSAAETVEAAKDALKVMSKVQAKPIYKVANKAGRQIRSANGFPDGLPANGTASKVDHVACPTCKADIAARTFIKRFLRQ